MTRFYFLMAMVILLGCSKEPEELSEYTKDRLKDPDTTWASSVTVGNVKAKDHPRDSDWRKTGEYIMESMGGDRVHVEYFESGEWVSVKWTPLNEPRDTEHLLNTPDWINPPCGKPFTLPTIGGTDSDD